MIYEDKIRSALTTLDCSADFLCAIAEISSKKLSRALSGIQALSGPELTHLMKTIENLKGLASDADPYPVSFRRVDLIRRMLERRKAGIHFIPIPLGPQAEIADWEAELEAASK
jgi:hypothetical protein